MTYNRPGDLSIGSYVVLAMLVVGWEALGPSTILTLSAFAIAAVLVVTAGAASIRHCVTSRQRTMRQLQKGDGEPAQMGGAQQVTKR
jgi:membrane protein implicated in regulation of membrane protease activity